MRNYQRINSFRCLRWDKTACRVISSQGITKSNKVLHLPNAELARYFGRNDSLGSSTAEGTLNAVNGQARRTHATHKDRDFVGRQSDGCTSSFFDIRNRIVQTSIDCPSKVQIYFKNESSGSISKTYFSSSSGGATISSTPLIRMSPCGLTRVPRRLMRSVIGSCTVRPKTPE